MFRMVRTEIWKLKRYHMIWAGILLMLLSVLLTMFSTTASDGTVWTFSFFTEQVLKNNITMIFPMCITLLAGYIITREKRDDTLKSIMTVPVSYGNLLWGKLFVCGLLSLFLGFVSAIFTVIANWIMRFPGVSITSVLQTFMQIILNCFFLYIAVMPIITVTARILNGHLIGTIIAFVYGYGGIFAAGNMKLASIYPITASMGLILYRSYDEAVNWNIGLCGLSMIAAFMVSVAIVAAVPQSLPVETVKKQKRTVTKKGW